MKRRQEVAEDAVDGEIEREGGIADYIDAMMSDDDPEPPKKQSPWAELALTDRFAGMIDGRWKFVREWDTWYEWRGDGWYPDSTEAIKARVMEFARGFPGLPGYGGLSPASRRGLGKNSVMSAIVSLAAAHRSIATSGEQWDADPMLLGVPGGVVDMKTGLLLKAAPEQYISRRTAVAPASGTPKLWVAHLHRVMQGNQELIRFWQRLCGYVFTGEVGEHALAFLYGHGANGKGTIIETLVRLAGDYGYAAPTDLLMESMQKGHPTELWALKGKRVVSYSEPPQGAKWDDGRIRWLTGGDTITARKMNSDFSSFQPTHKFLMMGNHKPTLRSVDEAIKRRFNILDFSYTIPPEERDPHFMEKLREEWAQILAWCLDGCLMWQEEGLSRPDSMVQATAQYLQTEDLMESFISECCERGQTYFDTIAEIYKVYKAWCDRTGEKPPTRQALQRLLFEHPGLVRKSSAIGTAIAGMRIKESFRSF